MELNVIEKTLKYTVIRPKNQGSFKKCVFKVVNFEYGKVYRMTVSMV